MLKSYLFGLDTLVAHTYNTGYLISCQENTGTFAVHFQWCSLSTSEPMTYSFILLENKIAFRLVKTSPGPLGHSYLLCYLCFSMSLLCFFSIYILRIGYIFIYTMHKPFVSLSSTQLCCKYVTANSLVFISSPMCDIFSIHRETGGLCTYSLIIVDWHIHCLHPETENTNRPNASPR